MFEQRHQRGVGVAGIEGHFNLTKLSHSETLGERPPPECSAQAAARST
jgi:hypothetical protein